MKKFKQKYPRAHRALKYTGSAISIAKDAYSIASTVASLINPEKKYYTIVPTTITVSSTPTLVSLASIATGIDSSSRIGDSIALKSMQMRNTINWKTAGGNQQIIRRIIFFDRNNSAGVAPSAAQVLESVSVLGLRNMDYSKRFKILSDQRWSYDTTEQQLITDWFYKVHSKRNAKGVPQQLHCTFTGTLSSDYANNQPWVMYLSNIGLANNPPTIDYTSRVRYIDN